MSTRTFSFSCSNTDDDVWEVEETAGSGGWPPGSPFSFGGASTGATTLALLRYLDTGSGAFYAGNVFLRFSTASIPDDATITAANLTLYLDTNNEVDAGRSLLGQYYDFGGEPATVDDWVGTTTFDAFSVTWASLGAAGSVKTIPIADLTGISKTGYTGLRLKADSLTGAPTPTGGTFLRFGAAEHATFQEPRLIVDYTPVPDYHFDYSQFPKPKLRSAVPVRW